MLSCLCESGKLRRSTRRHLVRDRRDKTLCIRGTNRQLRSKRGLQSKSLLSAGTRGTAAMPGDPPAVNPRPDKSSVPESAAKRTKRGSQWDAFQPVGFSLSQTHVPSFFISSFGTRTCLVKLMWGRSCPCGRVQPCVHLLGTRNIIFTTWFWQRQVDSDLFVNCLLDYGLTPIPKPFSRDPHAHSPAQPNSTAKMTPHVTHTIKPLSLMLLNSCNQFLFPTPAAGPWSLTAQSRLNIWIAVRT